MSKRLISVSTDVLALFGILSIMSALVWTYITVNEETSPWFTVNAFHVPPHYANERVVIDFKRTIYKNMGGRWRVERQIKYGDKWQTYCAGSGVSNYSPDEGLPPNVTLDWFIGPCIDELTGLVSSERPGKNRLQVNWTFTTPNDGRVRVIIAESNEYSVYPNE